MINPSYKPIPISNSESRTSLERYVEDICNLNHIGAEDFGNILFSVSEMVNIMFGLQNEFGLRIAELSAEVSGRRIRFQVKANGKQVGYSFDEDEIEREIKKARFERELFILRKLTDKIYFGTENFFIVAEFDLAAMGYERVMKRAEILKQYWERDPALKGA